MILQKNYQKETQFKIYLTNPSLRCALFEPIKELNSEIGDMVEKLYIPNGSQDKVLNSDMQIGGKANSRVKLILSVWISHAKSRIGQ